MVDTLFHRKNVTPEYSHRRRLEGGRLRSKCHILQPCCCSFAPFLLCSFVPLLLCFFAPLLLSSAPLLLLVFRKWKDSADPVMTAYKLVTIQFKW